MADSKHGKSSKAGRARKSGQNLRYQGESRHEKGHVRRIAKHLKRFPDDKVADNALKFWKGKLGGRSATR